MESGLIFNQLICEFESRHPCQFRFTWVVAQLAEHRTVTAAREGSTPFDPPKMISERGMRISDWFLMFDRGLQPRASRADQSKFSNPHSAIFGTVAER